MKKTMKLSLFTTLAIASLAVAVPVSTHAIAPVESERYQEAQQRKEAAQEKAAEKKEAAHTRLADAKLKACQNREKAIKNIMTRIGDRGQKQIDLFTKISDRTQAFYVEKNKILSNYDSLVTEVTAKKTAAQEAVDATKAITVEFTCDGTDPKSVAAAFKQARQTQNDALKAYKTAVKNLIVGVKSVQGTTSSGENTSTENSSTGGEQ